MSMSWGGALKKISGSFLEGQSGSRKENGLVYEQHGSGQATRSSGNDSGGRPTSQRTTTTQTVTQPPLDKRVDDREYEREAQARQRNYETQNREPLPNQSGMSRNAARPNTSLQRAPDNPRDDREPPPKGSQQDRGNAWFRYGKSSHRDRPEDMKYERDARPSQPPHGETHERTYMGKGSRSNRAGGPQSRTNSYYQADDGYASSHEDPLDVIDDLRAQLKSRQQQVQELSVKNSKLMDDNDKLSDDIRLLQEKSFNAIDDARWMPMDVSTITGELNMIRDSIGSLAKTYAAKEFANLDKIPLDMQQELRTYLQSVVRFDGEGPTAVQELLDIKHAPRLCLTALISTRIHFNILNRAFFFVNSEMLGLTERAVSLEGGSKQQSTASQVLSSIYMSTCDFDVNKANVWRSDTVRLLNPLHLADDKAAQHRLKQTRDAIEDASKSLAYAFDFQLIGAMLRPAEKDQAELREQFRRELTKIFVNAGRLSVRLWCQRPSIACYYLADLTRERFKISSSMLQAHSLHRLDDPEDHGLDGQRPKILVHPAVLAMGSHNGDRYDRHQVWAKAVAWLEG